MANFSVGDRVMSTRGGKYPLELVEVLYPVPPGPPTLYRCRPVPRGPGSRCFTYPEKDLVALQPMPPERPTHLQHLRG